MLAGMDLQLPPESLLNALDDETLAAQRPAVRSVLVGKLRALLQATEEEMESGKDAIRWGELHLRTIDRLIRLYRLDETTTPEASEDDSGADQARLRASVSLELDDLSVKLEKRVSG